MNIVVTGSYAVFEQSMSACAGSTAAETEGSRQNILNSGAKHS